MPSPVFTPGDTDQDDSLNPGNRSFSGLSKTENAAAFDSGVDNNTSLADPSQENENIKKLGDQEESAGGAPNNDAGMGGGGWKTDGLTKPSLPVNKLSFLKKRGPMLGIGGGIGAIIFFIGTLFSPSLLLTSLTQNAVSKNDSRGTVLERRFLAAIQQKTSGVDGCKGVATSIACRLGRMPNSMLAALKEKGITAYSDAGGTEVVDPKGNGYPDENPKSYSFKGDDGVIKTINASELATEYRDNPAFRKMFKSAFNMRYLGYNGKYMVKNFFKKFGIERKGGMAADKNVNESTAVDELDKKLKPPDASITSEVGAKGTFKERIEQLLTRSGKRLSKSGGDPILTVATTACTVIELPKFIAGTYRAIQMAQLAVLVSDMVLSPGSMQQASKADATQVSAIGNLLTERPKNDDGSLGKSALDSAVLLSAIGVNKNKVSVSKYAPGYSLVTNSIVQLSTSASASLKTTCNLVNTPQAMLAVSGIEAAISAASVGTGAVAIAALKGVGKAALALGAVTAVIALANKLGIIDAISDKAYAAAKSLIGNYVDGARYEALGDAVGSGLLGYFSQAGSVGGAATLTMDQVSGFEVAKAEVDNEYKDEAIATLSPFDTSSKYTFLGSILSNLSLYSIPGNPLQSAASILGHVLSSPLSILGSSVSAQDNSAEASCGYASEFGLESSVAVNAAGYPCVGIPAEYLNMPREAVYNLVADQVDPTTGEPKENSEIDSMMADCSDGDLEGISGCTIASTQSAAQTYESCYNEDGDPISPCVTRSVPASSGDAQKRAAESLYLFDLQVENILSGEDDESNTSDSTAGATASNPGDRDDVVSLGQGWTIKESTDYSSVACEAGSTDDGTYTHPVEGFTIRKCKIGSADVNSLVSGTVVKMIAAAAADGVTLTLGNSFRSYEEQKRLYSANCDDKGNCSPPTAKPGNSQHERGLAIDFGSCDSRSTACYKWLAANASTYGYYNLPSESWHWSMSGY